MNEVGIDISSQVPKHVGLYLGRISVRQLFIVCHDAESNCPRMFPGMQRREFWPLDDPAAFIGPPDEKLDKFRSIRDELHERIIEWLAQQD